MEETIQTTTIITLKPKRPRNRPRISLRRLAPFLTLIVLLLLWQVIVTLALYPAFLVPSPAAVADKFLEIFNDGRWWHHTSVTLEEMLVGLVFGVSTGIVLGYAIAKSPVLEDLLSPIIVAFQSTPIVAYAPLLIIWFGSGTTSKIVTTAIIVFFPTLMNTIVGIRNLPSEFRDLMSSFNATRWQVLTGLEIPAAMPVLLAGLKTSVTLAVIGAVVGEFVSAGAGLGYLVTLARNQYDTALVFVAVITMTCIALSLYSAVSVLEWRLLAWQKRAQ